MKKRKLELTITVGIYLLTALLSASLALLILTNLNKLTEQFLAADLSHNAILPILGAELLTMILSLYDGKYKFDRYNAFHYIHVSGMATVLFSGIWAAILLIQKNSITDSRHFFVSVVALHFILLMLLLASAHYTVIASFYKTSSASYVLIATTREKAPLMTQQIKKDWSRKIIGLVLLDESETVMQEEIDHIPVVAGAEELTTWVRKNPVDEVYLIVPETHTEFVSDTVEQLVQMGVSTHINLSNVEELESIVAKKTKDYTPRTESRLGFLEQIPMVILEQQESKLRYLFLKRLMDIAGGIVGMLVTVPLYIILGILIKLDSPGPILFHQVRIGKNGRTFKMYKFRSMYRDAETRKAALMEQNEMKGLMFKMKDDPRITRVGKFIRKTSLDEFPQFYNVLVGDMSLVGTRPPTANEFAEYSNYQKRRLSMKPGITGMWQVSGRSDIKDFEEVVRLDCKYIDNWSLLLDIKILFRTVLIVFNKRGSE